MVYRLLSFFFRRYLHLLHLVEVSGAEHIPAKGPVILCANHSSYLDSMLVGICTRRPVRFLIHQAFYRHRLFGFFIRSCGAIPVTQGHSDREAMRRATALLARGEVLGIFPEGRLSRTGLPAPGKPGAALLAATVGAPIVPITIAGAFFVYPKGEKFPRPGKISIKVHPQLPVDPARRKEKRYLEGVTGAVMERIARSLPPTLRARRRKETLMKRPLPVAWYEYLPAGVAIAVLIASMLRGDHAPGRLFVTGLMAVGVPSWLAVMRRLSQRKWARYARYFLPLLLLFPLHHILVRLVLPGTTAVHPVGGGEVAGFHYIFVQGAVIAYLFALLTYAFFRKFAGFRRLSLGIQATTYLTLLPFLFLPFLPVSAVPSTLVTLMTFLLFYDLLYRQPSLIASFIVLAVLKVVSRLGHQFDPVTEGMALLIPAVVLVAIKTTGFSRR